LPGWKIFPKLPAGRLWEDHSSLMPVTAVHVRLCHGNPLALRLDRKAVLLEIAGGEVRTNAGQNFGQAPGRRGRIKHRPINPVV
jgi:hypothetical protein